jgi:hypothetical protein
MTYLDFIMTILFPHPQRRTKGNVALFSSWLLSETGGVAAGFRLAFPEFFSESSGAKFMPTVCTSRVAVRRKPPS